MPTVLLCRSADDPCTVQAWVPIAELIDPALFGITTASLEKVFGWGFGAVLLFFLLGLSIGVAVGLVRRL